MAKGKTASLRASDFVDALPIPIDGDFTWKDPGFCLFDYKKKTGEVVATTTAGRVTFVGEDGTEYIQQCPFGTGNGYGAMRYDGRQDGAHRIAWRVSHGDIPGDMCVCHECDNPLCCNPAHLFLGTPADNRADCVRKMRHATRESNGRSKLTQRQVAVIRRNLAAGVAKRKLARIYGVSDTLIRMIDRGTIWRTQN